jgi:predicted N-acyltransferase
LGLGFWSDLYHRSMTVYWPVFFGSAAHSSEHGTRFLQKGLPGVR